MTELESGENILSVKASGAVTAGDHVEINGARQARVVPAANEGQAGLGIALHDASDGDPLAVAVLGCVVRDANVATAAGDGVLLTASGTAGRLKAAGINDRIIAYTLESAADNKAPILITGPGGIHSET